MNLKTIPDRQPLPRVQVILDSLFGQAWFTILDMSQDYHQGYMHKNSQQLTAFSTPWSLYEWVRIPYGLMNVPPAFQRFMNECLSNMRDVLVYGRTFEEHTENVPRVLRCLKEKGIKLNPLKCDFFKNEIKYLVRLISKNGYCPDPENSIALEKRKIPPKTVGELRTLLGFLGYYRDYVQNFSQRLKPLYELLQNKSEKGIPKL